MMWSPKYPDRSDDRALNTEKQQYKILLISTLFLKMIYKANLLFAKTIKIGFLKKELLNNSKVLKNSF